MHKVRFAAPASVLALLVSGAVLTGCFGDNNPYGPPYRLDDSVPGGYWPTPLLVGQNSSLEDLTYPPEGAEFRLALSRRGGATGRIRISDWNGQEIDYPLRGGWEIPNGRGSLRVIFEDDASPGVPELDFDVDFMSRIVRIRANVELGGELVRLDLARPAGFGGDGDDGEGEDDPRNPAN